MSQWSEIDGQLNDILFPRPRSLELFSHDDFDQSQLATQLASDLETFFERSEQKDDRLLDDLNSPVSLLNRRDALEGYFHLMQSGDIIDPVLQRARIVSQLYFDLIYFRDRVLILLYQYAQQLVDAEKEYPHLMEWLQLVGDNDFALKIRSLRNGFAHGKWHYLPDFSGIVCYPERNPPYSRHEFSQDDLGLIHALFYAFQVVLFSLIVDGA